jgi:hypothetical protein
MRKAYDKKELKRLFEMIDLDTGKYRVEYLAEQLGFRKVSRPRLVNESSLRAILEGSNLNTKKYTVAYLAEQLGIEQALVESTGERLYILEAGFDFKRLAKTLGITAALGLAPVMAGNMANVSTQPLSNQAPSSEVVAPSSGSEVTAYPKAQNPTVPKSVALPTAEELQKAIEQANKNKQSNANTEAELGNSGARKIGSFSYKNKIGDKTIVPGQEINYAYKKINFDKKSPAFEGLTQEQIDSLVSKIESLNNRMIPFQNDNVSKLPDNSFFFLDKNGDLRSANSKTELQDMKDRYGVWKDTDGSNEYDVHQAGDSGLGAPLFFVPEVDDTTGEEKTEKWSTNKGKGTSSEGHGRESKTDETNKHNNKPLIQVRTGEDGKFDGYEYVDNSNLDDYDGDVYMLLPNKGLNSYDEISNSIGSVDASQNYENLLSRINSDEKFQKTLNKSIKSVTNLNTRDHIPENPYLSYTDYVNHLDSGSVNRQYFDARSQLGDKDVTLDDLKDDMESRDQDDTPPSDQIKKDEPEVKEDNDKPLKESRNFVYRPRKNQ